MTQTSIAKVANIEAMMAQMPQVEVACFNHFSKGVYAREIHIPAGTTLTGRIHKFENLNILSKGAMLIHTDEGAVRVEAPYTVVSPPGTKRIAHCLTDCVWTTIHGTDEQDIEVIQEKFTAQNEQAYLQFRENLKLGA